jgi:hypothetical protein
VASLRETILPLVDELRRLDPKHRVFGAEIGGNWGHGYRFNDRLDESSVRAFEMRNGLQLPSDYREFITQVGDGGAGPHYGIYPLAQASEHSDLSKTFPWNAERTLSGDDVGVWDAHPGALVLSERGCGHTDVLVVRGEARSTIWSDFTNEDGPLTPCEDSFRTWYVRWATRCIATIEREPLIAKVKIGMTLGALRGLLGDDMQRWEPAVARPDSPAYYVGFTNTNASFSMGPDDRVTAVNRMGFV